MPESRHGSPMSGVRAQEGRTFLTSHHLASPYPYLLGAALGSHLSSTFRNFCTGTPISTPSWMSPGWLCLPWTSK